MMETITGNICVRCGREEYKPGGGFYGEICSPCHTMQRVREDKAMDQKSTLNLRLAKWDKLCPETYRTNETDLIDQNSFKKVNEYRLNARGILCMGDSRTGKTTTCWKLLETLYVLHGIPFKAMTESEFSQLTAKAQRNRNLDQWLDEMCHTKILFIDDIGHVSATKSHLEELYYIIEKRTSWKKPIIATTQFSPNELMERARSSSGEKTIIAILNRLKAHCEIINF